MPFGSPDSNEVHNLDDVNDRLYRRDLVGRKGKHIDALRSQRFSVKKDWADGPATSKFSEAFKPRPSFFRKFFYVSLGFAGLAVVIALITLFTGGNTVSTTAIDINILGNSFAAGGEELPLQAEIVNKNTSPLELADLFIEYDKGGDSSGGASHVRDLNSLGTIPAGKAATKSFFVTLYGQEGSVKNIDFTLQYRLHGSNAIFVKKSTFPITINSAPVSLSVDAPQNVTPNQQVVFTVKTISNSKNTLSGMLLHVDYPNGFNFEKAVPAPNALNNVWNLGDLAPSAERDIVITGTVYGQSGEDRAFHVYTGAASAADATKIGVTYNSLLQTVSLVKPFLSAHILVNGDSGLTTPVSSGGSVNVVIAYENNLPTQITNAQVTLALAGNAIDPASIIVPKGFYDSATQTITWDRTTETNLESIQPSDQGQLSFSFALLPLFSGGKIVVFPSEKLSVSIKGKQPDQGGSVNEVTDFEEKTIVVDSDLGFSADGFYKSGPFSNTGPIPPKANQPTTYTVTWMVTNSSNALSDGLATASLPPYVDWVGTVSPQNEPLTYDPTTSTIRWAIGSIPAGTGLSAPSRTVSFQVRLNPSLSQVGSIPKLVLDTSVSARDTFTGESLSATRAAVSTLLLNDADFPEQGQTVTN